MISVINTRAKRIEAALVFAAAIAASFAYPLMPPTLKWGEMIMAIAVVLFVQTLIRDLCRGGSRCCKVAQAHNAIASGPVTEDSAPIASCGIGGKGRCLCAESAVGIALLAVGFAMLIIPVTARYVTVARWFWPATVIAGGALGLALRDYVYDSATSKICYRPDAHD